MKPEILRLLRCPQCGGASLESGAFSVARDGSIEHGVVWCSDGRHWFPVEDGVLELLSGASSYAEDRDRFRRRFAKRFEELGLGGETPQTPSAHDEAVRRQQAHFDWYAANNEQTYAAYESMPFWRAADALAFDRWRREVRPGASLLDVACAQGRSTFPWMDLDLEILGFDVSKALIRQATERYRRETWRARATFLVADATRFPLSSGSFDYALGYGVLHHMPNPRETCREIARVLRPGGVFFGSENNRTPFRRAFDLMQSFRPLWHEEAGAHALISAADLRDWLEPAGCAVSFSTSVFVPPHAANWLGTAGAKRLLRATDRLARAVPLLRDSGGLILVRGEKRCASATTGQVARASVGGEDGAP